MNSNIKNLPIRIISLFFIILLSTIGCSGKPKIPVMAHIPERIITDFSDMNEHEFVSWAWIRRGFALANCRSITVEPVADLSQIPQPKAVARFEQELASLLEKRTQENAALDAIVYSTVIETRVNPGRVKKWFIDFDNFPYFEVEIIIIEKSTGLPLLKIIHFGRDKKKLNNAVSKVLTDLEQFFFTAL